MRGHAVHARAARKVAAGSDQMRAGGGDLARRRERHHAHGIEPSLRSCARSALMFRDVDSVAGEARAVAGA